MRMSTLKKTVLIIDTDVGGAQLLHDMLDLDGFDPVVVSHLESVKSIALGVAPDAFVMTVMLPPTTAIELAAELRESFEKTPMIALTSSMLMRELAEESELFTAVLDRPPDFSILLDVLLQHSEEDGEGQEGNADTHPPQ